MRKFIGKLVAAIIIVGAAAVFITQTGLISTNLFFEGKDRARRLAVKYLPNTARDALSPKRSPLMERMQRAGFQLGDPVHVRIFKADSKLEIWVQREDRFALFETFDICKWSGALGPKLKEGDRQSPEGFYEVTAKQLNPNSQHHLSFNLGFPNAYDRSFGRTGSALMVHGGCSSIGCYAITDSSVDDVYALVEAALRGGQRSVPVHVFPFQMDAAVLARHRGSQWDEFWENLKEGHDLFVQTGIPAVASACNGRYVFNQSLAGCTRIAGW